MNDLNSYLANKCLETSSAELVKQAILEDMTLSPVQKQNWIPLINTMSAARTWQIYVKFFLEEWDGTKR